MKIKGSCDPEHATVELIYYTYASTRIWASFAKDRHQNFTRISCR